MSQPIAVSRPLLVIDAGETSRVWRLAEPVMTLAEMSAAGGATCEFAHVLVMLSVGRVLRAGELAVLRECVGGRPRGSWRLAVLDAQRQLCGAELETQVKMLERVGSLLSEDAPPPAALVLGPIEGPARVDNRHLADVPAIAAWLAEPIDLEALSALQEARAVRQAAPLAADGGDTAAAQPAGQAQATIGRQLALERQRVLVLSKLAEVIQVVEAIAPDLARELASQVMAWVKLGTNAPATAHLGSNGEESAGAAPGVVRSREERVRHRLGQAWDVAVTRLRSRLEDQLAPWRVWAQTSVHSSGVSSSFELPQALPAAKAEAPEWSVPPMGGARTSPTGVTMSLGGGAIGALVIAGLHRTLAGFLLGGAVGAIAAPVVAGAYARAAESRTTQSSLARDERTQQTWRQDAEIALMRELWRLQSAIVAQIDRSFDRIKTENHGNQWSLPTE
jgi:hypothetical protein